MRMTQTDTEKISKKIARHFKFTLPGLNFRYNTDHGLAKLGGWGMNLPKVPTLGLLLHELAHFHNYEKKINYNHNKKLMRTIRRFVKYCQKKNYWNKTIHYIGTSQEGKE